MLNYCVVSDQSFESCPKYAIAMSYLQESALLWGDGVFIAPKRCLIKRSHEGGMLLCSYLVSGAFHLLLAMSDIFISNLIGACLQLLNDRNKLYNH